MKFPAFLTLASVLFISACTSTPQDNTDVHQYRCESGEVITASYPDNDSASIEYKDRRYDMQIAISGSGVRYVGGEREWWTKGTGPGAEGTLFQHRADGATGQRIERCREH
ncbi:MAG: MliC family protein [Halomonas sp.]|nr:MliC family protein [Halomonas sp.]MDN6298450.1 MliC family protein [Halomonas sp.]MDN6315625.1 MliC family protein [Halomonas sp.]MDN6336877.1 MliC family protein [Halomonas sp.]